MRGSAAWSPVLAEREEARARHRFERELELERLRAPIRRELRVHGSQRGLAAEMRIARGCLRKFVEMKSVPTGRNRDALESWAANRPEATVTAGMISLALLAGELPADLRSAARRRLALELAAFFRAAGVLLPPWLHEELAAAGDESPDSRES